MKPLTSTTPHVIIMVGIPGAGKTHFAEHFAKTFQAPIVNTRSIGQAVDLDLDTTNIVSNLLLEELLKTNKTLIYEGPTDTKKQRAAISKKVTAAGYEPLFIWVQTESNEAKRRATKKQKGYSALTSAEFDDCIKHFQPPTVAEKVVVMSGKHTYATQLKVILKRLATDQRPDPVERVRPRPNRNIIMR